MFPQVLVLEDVKSVTTQGSVTKEDLFFHPVLAQMGVCKNGPSKRELAHGTALMNERHGAGT